MRWMKMAATVLAVMAASPALAQSAGYSIGSVNYTVPLPKGYCLPTSAQDVERMRFAESLDPNNHTVLSLVACGANATLLDYVLVKSPKSSADAPMTLTALMEILGPEFDKAQGNDVAIPETERKLGDAFSERSGEQVEVSMAIGPRGRDDICAYMGGTVVSEGLQGGVVAVGGCVTVIGGRMTMIFLYGSGNDPATIRALLQRSRAIALSVRVKK